MAEARAAADRSPGHAVVPIWIYFAVYVALLTLTGATVAASYVDMGPLNNLVAVGIAALKASLVVLYFMHVRWSSKLTALACFVGLFLLMTLIAGTLGDYFTRGLLGVPGK